MGTVRPRPLANRFRSIISRRPGRKRLGSYRRGSTLRVATLLISAGYDVATAEDGFGALLQPRRMLPDVVVSDLDMPKISGHELLSVIRRRFREILAVTMSGAYQGCDIPPGVVADSFFPEGERPKILLRTLEELLCSLSARNSDHHREFAPAWIPRNGNDSHGMPFVMLMCTKCLRAFQVTVAEETTGQVLAIPCCFCPGTSRDNIQPATHGMPLPREFCAAFHSSWFESGHA